MMLDPLPIAKLELGQFSVRFEDLPILEREPQPQDGKMYRSSRYPEYVFVYRKTQNAWDCFVRG